MKRSLLLTMFSCVTFFAFATHLRCGYITAHKVSCASLTYTITITVFTNTSSEVKFGEDGILNFGDGTSIVVPRVENIPRPDLGSNIGMASYTVNHTYAGVGGYLVSYNEPNRNGGILNMTSSFLTPFYTETFIDTDFCSTPKFISPPIFIGNTSSDFNVSVGAVSQDDVQMTYELVTPYRDRGTPVDGFIMPSGITLNYLTGLLNWNMSESDFHSPGEYNFAVRAIQWTREDDIWYREQYVRIDFQVILDGDTPEDFFMDDNQLLDQYQRIAVAAAEAKTIKVFYEIDNQYQPKLELFSALPEDAVSFITYDSVSTSSGQDIKVGKLIISPGLDDIRTNGYVVTVRGSHVDGSGKVSSDLSYLVYTADELPPLPNPIVTATEDGLTKVQVYPNPAHDFLDIDVAGGGSSTVLIYSAQGTLLKSQRFESHATMDTRNLPAGVYICDVRRNHVSVRKIKIIKSK